LLEVAILAGGEGKRLRNSYKPLLRICGKPILMNLIEKLEKLEPSIIIVVHTEEQENKLKVELEALKQRTNIRIIRDAINSQASLIGLYTALTSSTGDAVIVIPSDTPFLEASSLLRLKAKLQDYDAAIPIWPSGYIEPLIAIYRVVPALEAVKESLSKNMLQISSTLKRLRINYVPVDQVFSRPEIETFNINTYEDMERAEKICREKYAINE
jgi:molybdopterin-guanine dinucleotide biosynthesis protein A